MNFQKQALRLLRPESAGTPVAPLSEKGAGDGASNSVTGASPNTTAKSKSADNKLFFGLSPFPTSTLVVPDTPIRTKKGRLETTSLEKSC